MIIEINSQALFVLLSVIIIFVMPTIISGSIKMMIFWIEIVFTYIAVETQEPILYGLWIFHVIIIALPSARVGGQFIFGRNSSEGDLG